MSNNLKATIAAGKEKSIELRKHFDDMTTLQLRQFFKSSEESTLKKIMRNLIWAMTQKEVQEQERLEKEVEHSEAELKALQETSEKQIKKLQEALEKNKQSQASKMKEFF